MKSMHQQVQHELERQGGCSDSDGVTGPGDGVTGTGTGTGSEFTDTGTGNGVTGTGNRDQVAGSCGLPSTLLFVSESV